MNFFDLAPTPTFTFLSPQFWGFLVLALIGIWGTERRLRARNAFLFLVSLLFYWKTNGWFVALLLGSTAILLLARFSGKGVMKEDLQVSSFDESVHGSQPDLPYGSTKAGLTGS